MAQSSQTPTLEAKETAQRPAVEMRPELSVRGADATTLKPRLRTLLAVPVTVSAAFIVHLCVSQKQPAPETHSYTLFLGILFVLAIVAVVVQPFWSHLQRSMRNLFPV